MKTFLLQSAIAAVCAAMIPGLAQARAEAKSVVTGTLEIEISDHFKSQKTKTEVYVRDHATQRRVRVQQGQRFAHNFRGGETVSVKGRLKDATMEDAQIVLMQGGPVSNQPISSTTQAVLGVQKSAFLLVKRPIKPEEPYTPQEFKDTIAAQVNRFFLENSYQQTWLEADVLGWIIVPDSCVPAYLDGCVISYAQTNYGMDFTPYSKVIIIDNSTAGAGRAILGGKYAYAGGSLNGSAPKAIAHEIGHLFGLVHAGISLCDFGDTAFCTYQEVNDYVDTMSYGEGMGHFNAFAKKRLGWLDTANTPPIAVVGQSGTFSLLPIETRGPEARAMKILKDVDPVTGARVWYYVENRRPLGFDSFLSPTPILGHIFYSIDQNAGLFIHLEVEKSSTSRLLVHDPILPQDFESVPGKVTVFERMQALLAGKRFVDPDAGIVIEHLSTDPSGVASVKVTLGKPARVNLAVPAQQRTVVSPGASLALSAAVTPGDSSVAAVEFKIDGALVCRVTSAPYSCAWTVPSGVDQIHELEAVAVDSRGLSSDPAMALLSTDSTAPTLALTGITSGQLVTPGATITASQMVSDNLGVHYYETYLNGILLKRFSPTADSLSWTIPSYLVDATYVLSVKAFDRSGNSATESVEVRTGAGGTAALIPPTVNIVPSTLVFDGVGVNPYSELYISTSTSTPQSNSKISLPRFSINGKPTSFVAHYYLGSYSLQTLLLKPPSGQAAISVIGRDFSGISGSGAGVTLNVAGASSGADLVPPTVALTSPANGAILSVRAKVTIAANATDNAGVTKVDFHANGKRVCSDTATPYTCAWTVPRTRGASYVLEARAYDVAGNIGTSQVNVSVP
ncbi:MAG: Ig-like domain-containing protein [Oligoflexia bacterium]|nr:Ig-like domain-containing protein [Oligoflexia bacterium]